LPAEISKSFLFLFFKKEIRASFMTARDPSIAAALGRRRRRIDQVSRVLASSATFIALALLAWILFTLLRLGIPGLSLNVFTTITKSPGSDGGLANAIVGSLIQTALGTAIGTPIGLLAGTYLAEYAAGSTFGNIVRFVSDILLSAPSILIGLFIFSILVAPFGGFSGIAGAAALAVIVIPIVVRTTEDMLSLVPVSLREAAIALGSPRWKTTLLVCFRAARQGILTGILLAVARIAGETAPLLFTSLGNSDYSGVGSAMASLPVTIYQYAASAFDDWVQLAWTGALLITLGVLTLNILARLIVRRR
jgi:phosphate transport system permease protein